MRAFTSLEAFLALLKVHQPTPMSVPTYAGTIDRYRVEYHQRLETRQISSFVIPNDILNYITLIAYLMLPLRLPFAMKTLVLSAIVTFSILTLLTSRTLGLAHGVLVGISSSWCITLSVNLLFLRRPAQDFNRVIACGSGLKHDECSSSGVKHVERWQSMPNTAYKRLFWILDLLGSLRALHWSCGESQHPIPIGAYKKRLKNTTSIQENFGKLLFVSLCIDCLKEVIALDPYFWGFTEHDPPDYIKRILPVGDFIQAYRMLVAFAVLYIAIEFVSVVAVLLFVNVLGPSLAGTWGNEWAYSPQYGSFDAVCTRGLQGWWGTWWHQMFRLTLTPPANAIINTLHVPREGMIASTLRLVIPFLISGAIHASGSYTMWGNTRPINSFLFFVLQPVGIAVQIIGSWSLSRLVLLDKVPRQVRQATNIAFTAVWLLKTFPLLADDFARGGLWLTEPFPISMFQMLGLGSEARSHNLWLDCGLHVHSGPRRWQVGMAV